MENFSGIAMEGDQIELPPGFRFHPSDEELITHYLSKKVLDCNFSARAIGEVDMNKVEPWELPWKAKMGEKEWYFFCVRDKKYPTGLRTNRATAAGYWKATGKDKEIFRGKSLVGMKKTLVFYKGRAPKGEKSNWVIHEYRLDGKLSLHNLPKTAKNEWVICRVFQKSSGGKKVHISGLVRLNSNGNDTGPSLLPPLMDSSNYSPSTKPESLHVPCFSNSIDIQKTQKQIIDYLSNPNYPFFCPNPSVNFPRISLPNPFPFVQSTPFQGNLQYSGPVQMQENSIPNGLVENYDPNMTQSLKTEKEMVSTGVNRGISNLEIGRRSFEDLAAPSVSVGQLDFDCLWNY
ncbi:hypothetical protein LguiA_009607 [Lonicera macranthoides]